MPDCPSAILSLPYSDILMNFECTCLFYPWTIYFCRKSNSIVSIYEQIKKKNNTPLKVTPKPEQCNSGKKTFTVTVITNTWCVSSNCHLLEHPPLKHPHLYPTSFFPSLFELGFKQSSILHLVAIFLEPPFFLIANLSPYFFIWKKLWYFSCVIFFSVGWLSLHGVI